MVGKDMKAPTVHSVRDARQRIATTAVATPLRMSAALSQRLAGSAFLKIESMQHTGSFKLRGAANAFLSLDMQAQRRGVVTYSTGNHGKAVAFVARTHGAQALVCVSDLVPENKRVALVAGQGTIGLEILDVLPAVETIVVPLSGGGLLAGVAVAVKALKPSVRLVGVSSEHCPAMLRSIEAGRPVAVEERESLADSLGGGIGFSNRYTFEIVRCFVDEHVTVGEEAILEGMRAAFRDEGLVLEGAGAATIAACLAARPDNWRTPLVAVATGDNVDRALFARLVLAGLQ
jgi:threonine dehydratase